MSSSCGGVLHNEAMWEPRRLVPVPLLLAFVLVWWPAGSRAQDLEATPAAEAESAIPDELLRAWRAGDWETAQPLANAWRAERPGEARARVVNAGVRLRVPTRLVLRLDSTGIAAAFEEIGRIERQRRAAEVVGVLSGFFGTAGLGVALVGLSFDSEVFMTGGVAFPIAGGTTAAIALVAAAVAMVCVLDVPFRWQRWVASFGRF